MKLSDFEPLEKKYSGGLAEKYPGDPYVGIRRPKSSTTSTVYFCPISMGKLDLRKSEGIRYAKKDGAIYIYRGELGGNGTFKVGQKNGPGGHAYATPLTKAGLALGDYMLADPITVEGHKLYELVTVDVYRARKTGEL